MARTPRWRNKDDLHGIRVVTLSSWKYFYDYVRAEMLDYRTFIWRGQRCSTWLLEPTFDRLARKYSSKVRQSVLTTHLDRFKYATRGRRGPNPPGLADQNDWWALGQHHGLATPLLDWTESPFTAAYFAYLDIGPDQTSERAVYALSQRSVNRFSKKLGAADADQANAMTFFRPLSDENARLVAQGGLFSRAPLAMDVETWIKTYVDATTDSLVLIKSLLPDKDRELALRSLNRMNINHITTFPDLHGSSQHCNLHLQIRMY